MFCSFLTLDVDECKVDKDVCDQNAYCTVYPNSIAYSCQCKDGYNGDGFNCIEREGLCSSKVS